jgi:Phage integrase, N-terminal SAM-like domain
LNLKLQQRDRTRAPRAAAITLNQYLDQWLATVAKPRLKARTFHGYETLLRVNIRPVLGTRLIGAIGQMDMQELYAQMFKRGLSARTACTGTFTTTSPLRTSTSKSISLKRGKSFPKIRAPRIG